MSRPARERHILKWILASWKRLPRRDTVHKNNFWGTGMFFLQLQLYGLGKTSSVAWILNLWWVCKCKGPCAFLFKGPQNEHMKRLLWTFKWPYCTEAFRCHLMICKGTWWYGNVLGNTRSFWQDSGWVVKTDYLCSFFVVLFFPPPLFQI